MAYSHWPICKKRQEMAHSLCVKREDLAEHYGMYHSGVGISEAEALSLFIPYLLCHEHSCNVCCSIIK